MLDEISLNLRIRSGAERGRLPEVLFMGFLLDSKGAEGAEVCKSCRSRQELSNEYLHAKSASTPPRTSVSKRRVDSIHFFNSLLDQGENEPESRSKLCRGRFSVVSKPSVCSQLRAYLPSPRLTSSFVNRET